MLTFTGSFGSTLNLDLRNKFGQKIELQCFQFVIPPLEFRLMRQDVALQEWQAANTDMYDLQHPPAVAMWARNDHGFTNDLQHRHDVATSGVLSQDLFMETRGLALSFVLLVWLRESTVRSRPVDLIAL